MTLDEPLQSFWSSWRGLNETRRPTPWGEVVSDRRYPRVWESNHAAVVHDHERATATGIRTELHPDLRAAGSATEHVEFWDPPATCPALDELRAQSEHAGTDAIMVYRGPPSGPDQRAAGVDGVEARELTRPDAGFWEVYRQSRDEFDSQLPDDVVDQLVRRDRELLVPKGLRVFGGFVDGTLAGFASLISLAGVGYVDNVVTLGPYRRQGVGTATTARATAASLAAGDRMTHLLTELDSSAQALYERLGFRPQALVISVTRPMPPTG